MSDFWDREVIERHHNEWMALPAVREHINELIGGEQPMWPIDWFESWLRGRTFRRALSVGCGSGALERDLLKRGLCDSIDAFDGSLMSLRLARETAQRAGFGDRIRYFAADFNQYVLPRSAYDIVFFHQSAHHIARLERFFTQVLRTLKRDGLVYLDEYVGPSRFEWSEDRMRTQQSFYTSLPRCARISDRLTLPVQEDDPSEAIRSSEIEPILSAGFDVLARRPYGGMLLSLVIPSLRPKAIGEMLPYVIGCERSLIAAGVASFYAVIVATPKTPKIFGIARYASDRLRRRVKAELSAAAIAATATKM